MKLKKTERDKEKFPEFKVKIVFLTDYRVGLDSLVIQVCNV